MMLQEKHAKCLQDTTNMMTFLGTTLKREKVAHIACQAEELDMALESCQTEKAHKAMVFSG